MTLNLEICRNFSFLLLINYTKFELEILYTDGVGWKNMYEFFQIFFVKFISLCAWYIYEKPMCTRYLPISVTIFGSNKQYVSPQTDIQKHWILTKQSYNCHNRKIELQKLQSLTRTTTVNIIHFPIKNHLNLAEEFCLSQI
jgi:hypothetical protein